MLLWLPLIALALSADAGSTIRHARSADGADIVYTVQGQGDPALVFIHGGFADRSSKQIGFYAPWGMAYEIGEWQGGWTEAGGRLEIGGTYLAKWQKQGDAWLIRAEVFVPTHCTGSAYCGERQAPSGPAPPVPAQGVRSVPESDPSPRAPRKAGR